MFHRSNALFDRHAHREEATQLPESSQDYWKAESIELHRSRRSFLKGSGAYLVGCGASLIFESADAEDSSALSSTDPQSSTASFETTEDFDCLLDLPPVTPDCARLYICRHGQTENNRLHLVQGARMDPSINDNGYEQARRLGMTFSRLASESDEAFAIPSIVAHSKLRRARETAKILSSVAEESWKPKLFGEIPALGEVDFGSLEGKDSNSAKMEMMSTFASWAIGDIDKQLAGGESGRDVLERCVEALNVLSQTAVSSSTNTRAPSILAVSHSTYLRVLLSMVNDSPLSQSAFWKINNGSINVVDVNVKGKTRMINLSSSLFGGGRGLGVIPRGSSESMDIMMPESYLIRRNEIRHLNGMDV
ncbi:hypothetical protein HJC23_012145 [Cyclotella cryptica]|uniref:Uncharacterized protein n=1 Tax=Cyclotella cryptica TaxID=29204 RepID=A0ABD3PI98_9STRA